MYIIYYIFIYLLIIISQKMMDNGVKKIYEHLSEYQMSGKFIVI